jgi:hypothetical protein
VTTTQLILPQLPDNLENLHKEEERIRTNALLAINADTALKDHMNMIHASMDVIWIFTREHKNRTDDELTIQLLGIRLFNASASALALMLDGYYQTGRIPIFPVKGNTSVVTKLPPSLILPLWRKKPKWSREYEQRSGESRVC